MTNISSNQSVFAEPWFSELLFCALGLNQAAILPRFWRDASSKTIVKGFRRSSN
jgi:hypothetical protein